MAGIFICFIHWFIPDSWSCLLHGRHLISSCWIKYRNIQISPNKNGEAGRKILPLFLFPPSCHSPAPHSQVLEARRMLVFPLPSLLITPQPTIDGASVALPSPTPALALVSSLLLLKPGDTLHAFAALEALLTSHSLLHWTFVCFCLVGLVSDLGLLFWLLTLLPNSFNTNFCVIFKVFCF